MLDDPKLFKWYGEAGFYPVSQTPYDRDYFQKYVDYSQTELGKALTAARTELVQKFVELDSLVVDIGIGCGQFVEARKNTLGYDVNPAGVEWLHSKNLFIDPYRTNVSAMTFWDSLEHIEHPSFLLERCLDYVFVSIPIFRNKYHVLASKHFRMDEHYHYWTQKGFTDFMTGCGFQLLYTDNRETVLGREDILTFVFRRGR